MKEIDVFLNNINKNLNQKQMLDEIIQVNDLTGEYSLKLNENDVEEIIKTKSMALKSSGRIEFNGQIITKIIENFCDSPYISQYDYSNIINELVRIFYDYKNETLNLIGDEELIELMAEHFNGYCEGSLELLEEKVLYTISSNIRNGIKDYANIMNEKDL